MRHSIVRLREMLRRRSGPALGLVIGLLLSIPLWILLLLLAGWMLGGR